MISTNSIKLAARHEKQRQTLIDEAEKILKKGGLSQMKARTLAAHSGVAVGQIYNLFEDLDEVIIAVNSRTIARLEANLKQQAIITLASSVLEIQERLIAIATAYHHFARDNYHLWHALFDHQPAGHQKTTELFPKSENRFLDKNCGKNKEPEHFSARPSEIKNTLTAQITAERLRPFQLIERLLVPLCPTMSPQEVTIFSQTLFSSVHGIILLALDARDVGVPNEQIDDQLRLHLTLTCSSLRALSEK